VDLHHALGHDRRSRSDEDHRSPVAGLWVVEDPAPLLRRCVCLLVLEGAQRWLWQGHPTNALALGRREDNLINIAQALDAAPAFCAGK
jgi:hypothetical protein